MRQADELTPQNRLAICRRIAEETGFDAEFLNQKITANTAEGLYGFRDAYLESRRKQAIQQEHFTPRAGMDGIRPEFNDVRTNAEIFAEFLFDNGL